MKLSIFPLTPEAKTVIQYAHMLSTHSIETVLSFQEDLARLEDFEKVTGIRCTTSIKAALQFTDGIVLLDNLFNLRLDKYCSCIEMAKEKNKQIFASRRFMEQLANKELAAYIQPFDNEHVLKNTYHTLDRLLEVKVPVIAVMGLGENCSKLECQLEIKKYIDSLGYRTYSICSNSLGGLMGLGTLPSFIFENNLSFPQKIIQFNQYIHDLCKEEKPDVLILGVPSGIVPLSERDTNFFSEIPLIMNYAIHIDIGVLSFYFRQNFDDAYLENMVQYCFGKYEIPIEAFYLSRQRVSYNGDKLNMRFLFLSDEYLSQHSVHTDSQRPIARSGQGNSAVYQSIVDLLQQNIETV